jgi:hypothetical protein
MKLHPVEAELIHADSQTSHDKANTCIFDFSDESPRTRENKKTYSVLYAFMSVLINNHHIKLVDKIWEGYKATGETQDRHSMVCFVPL